MDSLPATEQVISTASPSDDTPVIYVWGRRNREVGRATSASEGVVTFSDYALRPLLRPGELSEVVPGLAATQHSGEGKANQYFLRGFNLDHGTDFSIFLDGVPLNLRTNAHGQGYLDINTVTPELIGSISYRKGTYYADTGDFSAAGTASFNTTASLRTSSLQVQAGGNGYGRLVGAWRITDDAYVAVDAQRNDGPWTTPEDLHKLGLHGSYRLGAWRISGLYYTADWNSADQIPLRAVAAGTLSPLGVIDPSDGGRSQRTILSARRQTDDSDLVVYAQAYRLNLWSNFTYFLDDRENGDQFEQAERRWVAGASASKRWQVSPGLDLSTGADLHYDDIGRIGLYATKSRHRLATRREDAVTQLSAGLWSRADWQTGALRTSLAVRLDTLRNQVDAADPANSGTRGRTIASPKLTLAYRLSPSWEFYGDWGRGFHSNDARGTLAAVDPAPLFAAATGSEIGARFERGGLSASLTAWALDLDSELVYSGDAGDTESSAASRRHGVEFTASYTPVRALNFDFSYAATHARYVTGERIPNALDYVLTAGVTAKAGPHDTFEVTFRRLGPSALIEDDSARSRTSTLVNGAWNHEFGRAALTLDVLNLLDSGDNDITYFYESRLAGEAAGGVADVHFHPQEPRQLRIGLKFSL